VGSTALKPNETTTVRYPFIMHPGMGGRHHFEITLRTDNPAQPTVTLTVLAMAGA
jgi:hypothetical protein